MDKADFARNAGVLERAAIIADAVQREDAATFFDALHELTEWVSHCDAVSDIVDDAVNRFFERRDGVGIPRTCSVCDLKARMVCTGCRTRFCSEHTPWNLDEPRANWPQTEDIVCLFECSICRERKDDGDDVSPSNRAAAFTAKAFADQ